MVEVWQRVVAFSSQPISMALYLPSTLVPFFL